MVREELESRIIKDSPGLPVGYNPLEAIRGGLYHWVQVPFNGVFVWCELRCLNATQVRSCGDYSSIVRGITKEITREQMIELRNYQEKLIIACMNRPIYNEIASLVDENDFVISEKRKELEEIKQIDLSGLPAAQREELTSRLADAELFLGFILPEDTFKFLIEWVNGDSVSDIKKITDEQFLEAAILAENGKDNPTDHLSGVFTDHNRQDMDRYAWKVYADYLKNRQIEIKTKGRRKVIGGPKK
jgi:NifU-like protein involved in Fe-S cluster formation